MDLILKTGFAEICNKWTFKLSKISKGEKLVHPNHVTDVREMRKDGKVTLAAFCLRQTSVTSNPYKVEIDASLYINYTLIIH